MLLLIIWSAVICAALYLYFNQLHSKYDTKDVKIFKSSMWYNLRILFKFDHFADQISRLYEQFPDERFVGKFDLMNPMLIVLDIELIKKITIKDFEYFVDHRTIIDGAIDPLFGRNLFSLKGDEWKDMRSTLSPAFTSSKIRLMVPFMVEVGKQMIKALKQKSRESQLGFIDVEVKDMTTRYANDVIASCGFGLKVDSQAERENNFYEQVKDAANMNVKRMLIFMGLASAPKLMKVLKLSLFSNEARTFFKSLVMSTMEEREKNNIIRPDMIHLLMEAKKGKLTHDENSTKDIDDAGFATVEESSIGRKKVNREWSDDDLTAQVILFFMAGFETVSSAMSFLLHELALNLDVQQKLYREIVEYDTKNGGQFDYNSIQNMTYMDMVVSEVLRLWPPVIALDRKCAKDYNCGKCNVNAKRDFILREGETLAVPSWAIHREPKFFPNPEKFDPERFSNENKHKIQPFTYMPFGLGPRNCIGSRFALCEVKIMAYQLLKEMELSPAEKTCIPAKLEPGGFNLKLQGGHWVRMTPRHA